MVDLREKLKGKVLILGIGNFLKQDDGVGPTVIAKLKIKNEKLKMNVKLLDGGMTPENITGRIKRIGPETLVIVDAIDFGSQPGEIKIFDAEEFGVRSFSTHNVSLKTFVGFIRVDLPELKVLVVGIQPKQTNFGEGLSPEVEKAVDELCTSFI